ncbi:MAG: alpha/beta hydrolase [Candidatus Hydrogenedentes bacterium]|nr:alpha/beta hydrolase [Candidatus Hydrogenedentota bacterium]
MKRSALTLLIVLFMAATAGAEGEAAYRQTQNVIYAEVEGVGLLMDVFAPARDAAAAKGLGIVCVISGAWKSDRGMVEAYQKIGIIDILCAHGYTVFAVRPGTYTSFTAEQMIAHINLAIRYVKSHAAEYGINPGRLGLTGTSAGGHLACLAATHSEADTAVQAVAVICPATDFLDFGGEKYGLGLMEWRLAFQGGDAGRTEQEKEAAAKSISPMYHVKPGLPPFLLIHGDADSLIPTEQSTRFAAALQAAGNSADLIIKPGGDHSWPTIKEEIEKLAKWFDTKLATGK